MSGLKILGVSGSPRKGGNSETLLDWTLEAAETAGGDVEKIRVCSLDINPCRHCGWCDTRGECVQKDGMGDIYKKYLAADRIVIATPLFFMNAPAQLKAFIDRFQCMWAKRYLLKKELRETGMEPRGWLLALGGTKGPSLFDGIDQLMKCFYSITDVRFDSGRSLRYRSVDHAGDILDHATARADAEALGRLIASED